MTARPFALAALLACAAPQLSPAAFQVNWDALTYPAGSLSRTYTNAGGSGTDVAVAVTGNTNRLTAGTPSLGTDLTGGLNPVQQAFRLQIDTNDTAEAVRTTFSFSRPVYNIALTLFDVDASSTVGTGTVLWQDRLVVTGQSGAGTVLPTLTGSAANVVTGNTVVGVASAANATAAGNVQVTFAGPVTQFTIEFGNGPNSQANPTSHGIAVHDISFTTSPAPGAVVLLASACPAVLGLAGVRRFRRRTA